MPISAIEEPRNGYPRLVGKPMFFQLLVRANQRGPCSAVRHACSSLALEVDCVLSHSGVISWQAEYQQVIRFPVVSQSFSLQRVASGEDDL